MDNSGPAWRKSSHSIHGNCVEIAWRRGVEGINIMVRDSKFPGREPLVFTPGEWADFLGRAKTGDFDVLAGALGARPAQDSTESAAAPVAAAPVPARR